MVDPDGAVHLLDFGIAKAAQGMDTTRTGVLKGKTSYLAPEQVRSAAVDRRTDLWALSVVLWELLAGRKMFEDEAEFDILQRIAQGDVPRLDAARPDLPAALVETVHHSLQVRPDDRFPDALALREALGRAARGAGLDPSRERTAEVVRSLQQGRAPAMTAPPPAAPAPRRTALWIAAFVVAAIAVFAIGIASSAWLIAPRPLVGDPVRMTFAPILPPAEMAAELEPLRADLEIALGRPVLLQIAPTYAATAALLQSGQTEIAVLPPRLFLDVEARMGDRLRPLAMTEVDRARGVDAVLIARRDLAWAGAETMRGRTLCLTDPASATGYALPLRWLADAGIGVADLAGTIESGDHHQVIRDVASGKCDVGAVYSSALRGAADTDVPVHLTRQVEVTGSTPNDAVCAGPGSDPELEIALKAALLAWDPQRTRGTRVVGSRQRLTGFVAFDASEYAPLRAALTPPEPAPDAP
jgi:ABC-type phosphate/phosphonate transport system substrate-binding protein